MATTLAQLLAAPETERVHTYTEKDVILYALGVGLGEDPTDEAELRFVYEKDLLPLPTLPVVLGAVRLRDMNLGLDLLKVVHGEQSLVVHRLPPVAGTVVSRSRITGVLDKGAQKGALIVVRRDVLEQGTGDLIASAEMTVVARGDGGIGSSMAEPPRPGALPARAADRVVDVATSTRAALIYRLTGDLNPLHAEPSVARQAGFERPILHGLATYGVVGYAIVKSLCGHDPAQLRSLRGRFSAPVLPGDVLQVSLWREPGGVFVRASVPERNAVVFDHGFAEVA